MKFEFDPAKEAINRETHGVDFSTVKNVFKDPKRITFPDIKHSSHEERFITIGHDGRAVLTVRFTFRNGGIRVIGAGYWRQERKLDEKQ